MTKKYILQKGTYIGALYKEYYTDRKKQKKVRLKGYIMLGIFSGSCVGMDITLFEIPPEKSSTGKIMYVIKSGRKHVGFFIKEEGISSSGNKYHYLSGKLDIGGMNIRINAYLNRQNFSNQHGENKESIPDYTIELAQSLQCGVVKLA